MRVGRLLRSSRARPDLRHGGVLQVLRHDPGRARRAPLHFRTPRHGFRYGFCGSRASRSPSPSLSPGGCWSQTGEYVSRSSLSGSCSSSSRTATCCWSPSIPSAGTSFRASPVDFCRNARYRGRLAVGGLLAGDPAVAHDGCCSGAQMTAPFATGVRPRADPCRQSPIRGSARGPHRSASDQ